MSQNELAKENSRYYESRLKRILNAGIVGMLYLVSWLPFSVIFLISDFMYLLLRYLVGYRKKVILENLRNAFPEKNPKEINSIANKFYRNLCDITLEGIKMHGMSENEINKRVKFVGLEQLTELYNQNKSLIALGMHYGNWEWASSSQKHIKHKLLMIYNPMRGNFALEKFILGAREKWGGECVPIHKSTRTLIKFSRLGKPTVLWLAADQTPPANSLFWTVFLNQETPFYSGPEKIASHTNQPVFFKYTKRVGRGKYVVTAIPLCIDPQKIKPHEILLLYIRKMEEIIKTEPENYLWSHRRWKHKRPENIPLTL